MADRTQQALRAMAREDPELAARLVLQTLPAAAARIGGALAYDLELDGLGSYRVIVENGDASVAPVDVGAAEDVDFRLHTDAGTLAELAAGASPLRLVLSGRLRIRGKRRRALRLRAMSDGGPPSMGEVLRRGGDVDPDSLYRALPYLIDPEWTRGHRFVVAYEISGEGGGKWHAHVRDGEPLRVTTGEPEEVNSVAKMSIDTLRAVLAGEMTPNIAMQRQLTWVDGEIYPVVLLGRWMERSQGRDDAELDREERQREVQARRSGTWGSTAPAGPGGAGQGDPGHESEGRRASGGGLLDYGQLYALWERQNWRAHELDFSVDREHWVASPRESQESTSWSLGSFYIGEERVTADLAPFLLAAPSGEVEVFLATQLVDEARHAAFFDRFGAEVMALDSDDLRGRMRELEATMLPAWHDVFDDGLREIANQIKARPDDLDLFVKGIATYHMVIEGVLATTGQHFILKYMEEHDLYPGFQKGFGLVERDEHRHIAFGVRFLKEAVDSDPKRFGRIVRERIEELVPKAAYVFAPAYAEDPGDFVSYGNTSAEIYGHAYRALKRRMAVIGLDVPPPEELMPGPIDRVEAMPSRA
jgi:ribonucleoside-diphosphate reductase beta chain